jgi:opacity protein-like surface antigen
MKGKIFIVGILILSLSTYSQSSKMEFGLKGGMNLFNFRIEQPEEYLETEINSKFNIGFFVGVFLNYNFNQKIKIQIEPNFQKKQTELSVFSRNLSNVSNSQTNDYYENIKFSEYSIESPLVIRYSINEKIEIEGGFNLAYILKEEQNRNIEYGTYIENDNRTLDLNEFETGLIIGGIYNVTKKIGLNLRYSYSLNEKSGSLLNKRIINIGIEFKI